MSATQRHKILMAGCGQLGSAIAGDLAARHEVWGLRRRSAAIAPPIHPLQADLTDRDSLAGALTESFDIVVYCVTPSSMDDAGYRAAYVDGLDNLLGLLEERPAPPTRVFFISSTGVYHQNDDSWVDESSPTHPRRFSGQRLLEAEARLAQSPIPGTSIRFSGIYGPGRERFLERVKAGWMPTSEDSPYTNRIHEADCVGVVSHLVTGALQGAGLAGCYLASDCEPARLADVVRWVRDHSSCAPPAQKPAGAPLRGGSKRCSNARLLSSGYVFRYPGFREGYGEILAARDR